MRVQYLLLLCYCYILLVNIEHYYYHYHGIIILAVLVRLRVDAASPSYIYLFIVVLFFDVMRCIMFIVYRLFIVNTMYYLGLLFVRFCLLFVFVYNHFLCSVYC